MKTYSLAATALLILLLTGFMMNAGTAQEEEHGTHSATTAAHADAGHADAGHADAGHADAGHADAGHAGGAHPVSGTHEHEHEQGEEGEAEILPLAHGIYLMVVFLFLGVPMGLSGLHRLLTTTGIWKSAPFGFNWAKHALKGKLLVVAVIIGLGGGLLIFALDGFDPGHALPHLAAGISLSVLFVIGGVTGLRLARGHAPDSLKYIHAASNLAGIALFLFQIATGLYMLLSH